MKLLIVDDQHSVHMFFDKMLDYEKLQIDSVRHVYQGSEALDSILISTPDIMILDIQMPVMDGLELLNTLSLKGIFVKTIILSAYNEFEYARKCMQYGVEDYLLKPIDIKELNEKLSVNVSKILRESFIALNQQLELCILDFSYKSPRLSTLFQKIQIKSFGFVCCRSGDSIDEIIFEGTSAICRKSTGELTVYLYTVRIAHTWQQFGDYLKSCTNFSIGLSPCCEDFLAIESSIWQSIKALEQGFYEPSTYVFNENTFSTKMIPSNMQMLNNLKQAYDNQDIQAIKLLTEKLFIYFRHSRISPQYVHEFCYSFLFQLGGDFFKIFQQLKGSSFTAEFDYSDALSLKNTFLRIMLNMLCDVQPANARTDSDVVFHIKNYIDSHCGKDLSLETMSTRFFISKYQISRIFKKEFDINYSDYILKIRMDTAASLLENSSIKLYELASQVGFEETSYFCNVFKKYYGITPKEYKQQKCNL